MIFYALLYSEVSLSLKKKMKSWKKSNVLKHIKKTSFFLRILTKMFKLILCFSEIPKTFICVCVRQVTFFIWGQKTNGIKHACPCQQGIRFRAWPIYAGFTANCHMVVFKYLSLSHKLDYQRSGLNTYLFASLFQCIETWFKSWFK